MTSSMKPNPVLGQTLPPTVYQRVRKPSRTPPPSIASVVSANDQHLSHNVNEELQAAFHKELETKELLLAQTHEKDQQILNLNDLLLQIKESLATSEKQLLDAYNEHSRMEDELCTHQAVTEKLREQLKEADREKRDLGRRYQEQVKSFEAERQSFYDNEQHLKSRIRSLGQARIRRQHSHSSIESKKPADVSVLETEAEDTSHSSQDLMKTGDADTTEEDDDYDTPEVSSLKLELSTLSTSYASLQATVQHLQTQVSDLQRLNNQLQDENESYNILLVEKTMAGQFDVRKQLYSSNRDQSDDTDSRNIDARSIVSNARSTLDRVSELEELEDDEIHRNASDYDPFSERPPSGASKHTGRADSPSPQGESLAGLPLTGPGLDLAAELGRAENQDDRVVVLADTGISPARLKNKRNARLAEPTSGDEVNTLRNEVKSLKDANKALSLYASKILDRIIAQEGFEHVLAVDYRERVPSPVENSPSPPKKARPQSAMFLLGGVSSSPSKSGSSSRDTNSSAVTTPASSFPATSEDSKRQRRSMSFDWRSISSWGSGEKKPDTKNLRPLTLRPGAAPIVGAKKLETEEDEEDRKERERLAATMKLMGIEPSLQTPTQTSHPETFANTEVTEVKAEKPLSRRWSLFRSTASTMAAVEAPKLTEDALHRAEANENLKQLDDKEQDRIEQLSRGSGSGFTEFKSRRSVSDEWRSRRDARSGNGSTGSASTVWSAGMSNKDERST